MSKVLQEGQPFRIDLLLDFLALDARLATVHHVHLAKLDALLLFLLEVVLVLALLLFLLEASVVLLQLIFVFDIALPLNSHNHIWVKAASARHIADVLDYTHFNFLHKVRTNVRLANNTPLNFALTFSSERVGFELTSPVTMLF